MEKDNVAAIKIDNRPWKKTKPILLDDGIYMPEVPYVRDGDNIPCTLVMTKEMFIEAYNRWILHDDDMPGPCEGKADVHD